jgi:hypothetical protein
MMARRWKLVFMSGLAIFVFAYVIPVARFYKRWYGTPVTFSKILDANVAYVRGDWLSLSVGALIVIGMAVNWAIEARRARQTK